MRPKEPGPPEGRRPPCIAPDSPRSSSRTDPTHRAGGATLQQPSTSAVPARLRGGIAECWECAEKNQEPRRGDAFPAGLLSHPDPHPGRIQRTARRRRNAATAQHFSRPSALARWDSGVLGMRPKEPGAPEGRRLPCRAPVSPRSSSRMAPTHRAPEAQRCNSPALQPSQRACAVG